MAKRALTTEPVAMSRIEHGSLDKDGKNVVRVFEFGDVVTGLGKETMDGLFGCGAVKHLASDAPATDGSAL